MISARVFIAVVFEKLPLDQLKIDQSFVRSLPNERRHGDVDAVIAVSKAVEVSVIAEGVETEQTTATCWQKKGCESRPKGLALVDPYRRENSSLGGKPLPILNGFEVRTRSHLLLSTEGRAISFCLSVK